MESVAECVICGDDMPEGRKLTCSHDCYMQYRFLKYHPVSDRVARQKAVIKAILRGQAQSKRQLGRKYK